MDLYTCRYTYIGRLSSKAQTIHCCHPALPLVGPDRSLWNRSTHWCSPCALDLLPCLVNPRGMAFEPDCTTHWVELVASVSLYCACSLCMYTGSNVGSVDCHITRAKQYFKQLVSKFCIFMCCMWSCVSQSWRVWIYTGLESGRSWWQRCCHPSAKDVPLVSTPATKCHEPCDLDSSVTLTERWCCLVHKNCFSSSFGSKRCCQI